MKIKPILIIPGAIDSVFFEIFFKSLKLEKFKSPLILITSYKIIKFQMKKFKFKKDIKIIKLTNLEHYKLNNKCINIIDVPSQKNSPNSYIKNCFEISFKLLKKNFTSKLINGPINKENFLQRKYLGMTEYISKKFKISKSAMLIYNKEISVCPLTTHLPLRLVAKQISKKLIYEKVILINNFFLNDIGIKPKIAVTGLNPHCESILKFNEDEKIVRPAIISLKKKGFKIDGPFPADTIFLNQNRKNYNVILGMYHDQVLSPIKTLKEYDAINITLGLPFYRVSPDHGPNKKMVSKNLSNPLSLIRSLKFLDKR